MTCPHRFQLPPPNGETVSAVCKRCGARKTWHTSPEKDWVRNSKKEKVT